MDRGKLSGIIYRWPLITVAACIALSCSSDRDDGPEDESAAPLPLLLKVDSGAGVGMMEEGSTVGVFFIDRKDGEAFRKNEMLIVDKGGMLMPGRDAVVPADMESYDFFAYSPYDGGWDDVVDSVVEFDVMADQSSRRNHVDSDLMLSYRIERKEGYAEVVFRHAMAKVRVHVTDRTGTFDMRFSSLSLGGLKLRSYIYMAEGTSVTDSPSGDLSCYPEESIDRRVSFAAVVPPQEIAGAKLDMTVGIGDREYGFTVSDVESLVGGKLHVFNIRMTERGLELEGTDVTDWEDDGGGNMTVAFE